LRVESGNLQQFRANFYRTNKNEVGVICFPAPVEGWIDQQVLVEDLVEDATPIAEFLQDASPSGWVIRRELAGPLLRAFLKMVFLDNFVHCDLHPGNVLVTVTNEPTEHREKRSIVFLDAGISTSLSPSARKNLRDLFKAVILNKGDEAGRLMIERAPYERCSQVEGGVEAFSQAIGDIVREFHDNRRKGLTLGVVRIGTLLSRVLDLCRIHGVELCPEMANIVVSTLVLEGLGRSLEPDLNLIDFAVPFVLGRSV
jgi:aarF domain-containing kinase